MASGQNMCALQTHLVTKPQSFDLLVIRGVAMVLPLDINGFRHDSKKFI